MTLTVSDLNRSVLWYERLFDTKLVLDEDPGPFRRAVWLVGGQTLVGFHQFPIRLTRSASPMAALSMLLTVPGCPSVIRTPVP